MSAIVYRPMTPDDAEAASRLILDAFAQFIAGEYSDEGRAEFTRYVQAAALVERSRSNHFVLMAMEGENPAGVIELRDNDHVSLLFVGRGFQRHGIGLFLGQKRPVKIWAGFYFLLPEAPGQI